MIRQRRIDELIDWMIAGAPPHAEISAMVAQLCTELRAAGVPIDRFALFIYALHPNLIGWRVGWTLEGGAQMLEGQLGLFATAEYKANPLPEVVENRITVRRRLTDPNSPRDYIIVDELRDAGFTDYLVQPIVYTSGEANAVSWSSKTPGGFSEEAVAVLEQINKPLARLTEAHLLRINAANVLSAYLGRQAATMFSTERFIAATGKKSRLRSCSPISSTSPRCRTCSTARRWSPSSTRCSTSSCRPWQTTRARS